MLIIPYLLAKFYIILQLTANCVWSEENFYVSRFYGRDNTTCGKKSRPCHTLSYAIRQVSEGSSIYLDGTNTSNDPYTCQPLDPGHPGIYFTESISFVGITSRAYISCLHGNQWMVDGTKHKDGLRINFDGITFQNTSLHFVNALLNIHNSSCEGSRNVTMQFVVLKLPRFHLSLTNVVFERNGVCMLIKSNTKAKIFINMANTSFIQSGINNLFASDKPSVLSLKSNRNDINIQIRNCSFKNNTFQEDGMISVANTNGTVKLSLYQFKFEQNAGPNSSKGVLTLSSDELILALNSGFIYDIFGTFVAVESNSSEIDISNTDVDKFNGCEERGGVFDINVNRGFLSIKDSFFRNGKGISNGGVLSITSLNLLVTIYNCSFDNIFASYFGGAINVDSRDFFETRNTSNDFVIELNLTKTMFSNCVSNNGGAIFTQSRNLVTTITDCLFVRNRAYLGVATFRIEDSSTIRLRNVNFFENNASAAGIFVVAAAESKKLDFTTNNLSFAKNNLYTQHLSNEDGGGIMSLRIKGEITNIVFQSTHFISNFQGMCSSISVSLDVPTSSNSITLDTCTFRKNVGGGGSFSFNGQALLICKHSTFDSHSGLFPWGSPSFRASTIDSWISITNSTFMNNSWGAVFILMNNNSQFKIEHSIFVRNQFQYPVDGGVKVEVDTFKGNDLSETNEKRSRKLHEYDVIIENVLFKENVLPGLTTLVKATAKIKLLNCMFIKNSVGFIGAGTLFEADMIDAEATITNTKFVNNSCRAIIISMNRNSYVKIEHSIFVGNQFVRKLGGAIYISGNDLKKTNVERSTHLHKHNVLIANVLFKENVLPFYDALITTTANTKLLNCTFINNSVISATECTVFKADFSISRITITNSTFANNSCRAVFISMKEYSQVKIRHSMFVRNQVLYGMDGAIYIKVEPIKGNDFNQTHMERSRNLHQCNVLIENVLFKENVAPLGGALAVASGNIKLLHCTFINNFARSQGSQIATMLSASMTAYYCVFKQTIQKIKIHGIEYIAYSSLGIYSTGELLLRSTTVESKIISNAPLIVVSRASQVNINDSTTITCPLGSALKKSSYTYQESEEHSVTNLDMYCTKCEYNFYSLQRGHAKGSNVDNSFKCIPCPRGAFCNPTIISKPNFWGYNASLNPRTLAFTLCPFGYCKSPQENSSKFNSCQGKRTGVMCGSCLSGYTEALWSTYCTPIKDCNDFWFWIWFLALVLSMAILLVFKPPLISYSVKHVPWLKRFATHEAILRFSRHNANSSWYLVEEDIRENRPSSSSEQLRHGKSHCSPFLEIVFYFYQTAQLLFSSYSLSEFFDSKILPPVLGFFNFEPRLHERGFLCPFPGLTPSTKLAFKIVPVFGTMLAIFTIYFFHVLINKVRRSQCPSVSSYLQASIKTVLLGYTTLATVGMSLIRCVSVAGEDRWFYNGNVLCYQWWQYVSIAFNGIFVVPLMFVLAWASFKVHHGTITVRQFFLAFVFPLPFLFLWLFRVVCPSESLNVEESENFSAIKEMFLGPYKQPGNGSKHGAMYWQSVLIARRFILVLIFCTVTEPSIRLFCMALACVFVLFFHLQVKPFRNSFANNLESLSLLLLVILGLMNLFKSVFVGIEGNIKGPVVTVFEVFQWLEIVILGLFPALVSLLVCCAIISLILRVLIICCKSFFECIFRRSAQRKLSQDTGRLMDFGEDIND